ncbi:hypothetical protein O181_072054 [Austropuccinia psidii MF-1]|uniref:Uncharacterized protein n=1 Tax=Austropuccinia psidii MF-1 TaxID=1389203 RepID=A0A9Q3F4F5_9BASI|nr:hypothetical protein [Austropuccinia psidii MF-1]
MSISNIQPKTIPHQLPDPTNPSYLCRNPHVGSGSHCPHYSHLLVGPFALNHHFFLHQSRFLCNIKSPPMPNQQHLNPLLFISNLLTDTDTSAPNFKIFMPLSHDSHSKAASTKFGSDSGIYHPMDSDNQPSEEYEGEDNEYIISEDSGLGLDDISSQKLSKNSVKRQCIQLF